MLIVTALINRFLFAPKLSFHSKIQFAHRNDGVAVSVIPAYRRQVEGGTKRNLMLNITSFIQQISLRAKTFFPFNISICSSK
jgi:hypothetical protein